MKIFVYRAVGAVMAAAAASFIAIGPASATSHLVESNTATVSMDYSCQSQIEKKILAKVADAYRVKLVCTYIKPGVKIRGVLDVPFYTDYYTPSIGTGEYEPVYSDYRSTDTMAVIKPKHRIEIVQKS